MRDQDQITYINNICLHRYTWFMTWRYWYATTNNCRIDRYNTIIAVPDLDDHIFDLGLLYQPKTCCILCKQHCANFTLHIPTAFPVRISHHTKKNLVERSLINFLMTESEEEASVSAVRAVQITRYLLNKCYIIKERLTNKVINHACTFIIFSFSEDQTFIRYNYIFLFGCMTHAWVREDCIPDYIALI